MLKMYTMPSCPDCAYLKTQLESRKDIEVIDIGAHVKNLKEFMRLRDANPAFDACKQGGSIGIPCFLFDSGDVSLDPADVGLVPRPEGWTMEQACCEPGKGC